MQRSCTCLVSPSYRRPFQRVEKVPTIVKMRVAVTAITCNQRRLYILMFALLLLALAAMIRVATLVVVDPAQITICVSVFSFWPVQTTVVQFRLYFLVIAHASAS